MMYRVKNWETFQHYKDRNPPWIKLHFELLSSKDWVMLDDKTRVLAIAIMLLASRSNGYIDGTEHGLSYLQRVAYLSEVPCLKPLINIGFLILEDEEKILHRKQMLAVASKIQADARPEAETEAETEVCPETGKSVSRPAVISEPSLLDFPVDGKTKLWPMTQSWLDAQQQFFPQVDCLAEAKKSLAWLLANPEKKKTAVGMPRFLNRWFSRASDAKSYRPGVNPHRMNGTDETFDQRFERIYAERERRISK